MEAYQAVRQRLAGGGTVLLDGGVGTELVRRGVRWRWHGLRTDPEAVRAVHEEYARAGADVIRTNTFQLNHRTYLNVFRDRDHMRRIGAPDLERRAPELIRLAVRLARQAADATDRRPLVAGVLSPLNHCFRPDLVPPQAEAEAEHREIARVMAEEGVDLFLLESMNTVREALAALDAARETGRPVWVSFVLGPDGRVLGGEDLAQAAAAVAAHGAAAVLVNCVPPDDVTRALPVLARASPVPVGGFAHIGRFDPPSWKFEFFPQFTGTDDWPPSRYAAVAEAWRREGARILGGCCGTTPAHIAALRRSLDAAAAAR
jgi:S-methylmethionine-dependent homocysteine/selenocysteine methylase